MAYEIVILLMKYILLFA